MKAIIYCRKSTESEEKQVQSIDAQLDWCRDYAKRMNFEVIEEIIEEKSAKQPWRVWFNKLMQKFSNNKAEHIITWKLNRLARNPIDEWTIKWLAQQFIIKEIHTTDWISNWHNILLMSVHFGMATQFLVDLSKDIKRWMKKKAQNWGRWRRSPLWYIVKDKKISIDPKTAPLIKEIFRLKHEKNLNNAEISREMEKMGLRSRKEKNQGKIVWWKPLNHKRIWLILSNPFYYWVIAHNWELYQWDFKPLITKNVYNSINSKEKKKYNFCKKWILKWIVINKENNKPFNVAEKSKKIISTWENKKYTYYHTTWKNQIRFSEKNIINYFDSYVSNFSTTFENREQIISALCNLNNEKLDDSFETQNLINEKITVLEDKKKLYIEMRALWELNHEEFIEYKNWVTSEILDLKQRSKEISLNDSDILEYFSKLMELAESLNLNYKTMNDSHKLEFIKNTLMELKIDKEKRLFLEEKPLFKFIRKCNSGNWWS